MFKPSKRIIGTSSSCLILPVEVSRQIGRSTAVVLQQIHYWLTSEGTRGITYEGKKWVYNSQEDWAANIPSWSLSTIRRAIKKLEDLEIVKSAKFNKNKWDQTKAYTIDYDKLEAILKQKNWISPSVHNESSNLFEMDELYKEAEITNTDNNLYHAERKICKKSNVAKVSPLPRADETVQHQMIEIWNETVEEGKRIIQLTNRRIAFLRKALATRFRNSLEEWKIFCQSITRSNFLMGRVKASFKASLDWALRFDVIQRIMEGDYGIGAPQPALCTPEPTQGIQEEKIELRENPLEAKAVTEFRKNLLNCVGPLTYKSWFNDVAIHMESNKIFLKTNSRFMEDWIDTHCLRKINEFFERRGEERPIYVES